MELSGEAIGGPSDGCQIVALEQGQPLGRSEPSAFIFGSRFGALGPSSRQLHLAVASNHIFQTRQFPDDPRDSRVACAFETHLRSVACLVRAAIREAGHDAPVPNKPRVIKHRDMDSANRFRPEPIDASSRSCTEVG